MMLVRSKDGIETVIKGLDGKLSEAIMNAMENGPDLEKKVSGCFFVNWKLTHKLSSAYNIIYRIIFVVWNYKTINQNSSRIPYFLGLSGHCFALKIYSQNRRKCI